MRVHRWVQQTALILLLCADGTQESWATSSAGASAGTVACAVGQDGISRQIRDTVRDLRVPEDIEWIQKERVGIVITEAPVKIDGTLSGSYFVDPLLRPCDGSSVLCVVTKNSVVLPARDNYQHLGTQGKTRLVGHFGSVIGELCATSGDDRVHLAVIVENNLRANGLVRSGDGIRPEQNKVDVSSLWRDGSPKPTSSDSNQSRSQYRHPVEWVALLSLIGFIASIGAALRGVRWWLALFGYLASGYLPLAAFSAVTSGLV